MSAGGEERRATRKLETAYARHLHHYGSNFLNKFGLWPKQTALKRRRSRYWLHQSSKWTRHGTLKPQAHLHHQPKEQQ